MKRLIAALLMGLAFLVIPVPAHAAAGWSGQRCDYQQGYAAQVCTQVYRDGGNHLNWLQTCAIKVPQQYYDGFRGIKNNTFKAWNGAGTLKVAGSTYDQSSGALPSGNCTNKSLGGVIVGDAGYYHAYGTLDLAQWGDQSWYVCGSVSGGGC